MNKSHFQGLFSSAFAVLPALLLISCTPQKKTVSFQAMDTFMTISAYGKNAEAAIVQAQSEISHLENLISTTIPGSEIFLLNHADGESLTVSPATYDLINFAVLMADKTDGALNPALYPITSAWGFTTDNYRVPSDSEIQRLLPLTDWKKIQLNSDRNVTLPAGTMLDLGAVGKGYAGNKILETLKNAGIKSAIIDLGGNVQTLGRKPDGSDWKVGIKNPKDGSIAVGITVTDKAVITSGGYERFFTANDGKNYIHIFDGSTGRPSKSDIASITIISSRGLYGDALSTALFVMGSEKATSWWKDLKSTEETFDFVIITKDERLMYNSGLEGKIQILADFSDVIIFK